jgi:hypothetical protein
MRDYIEGYNLQTYTIRKIPIKGKFWHHMDGVAIMLCQKFYTGCFTSENLPIKTIKVWNVGDNIEFEKMCDYAYDQLAIKKKNLDWKERERMRKYWAWREGNK